MEWNTVGKVLYFMAIFYTSWLEVNSQTQGSVSVTSLGCYKDRITKPSQSIFSTVFYQVNIVRWRPNSHHIIHSCATAAVARGYRIFSVQDFGDCRWGPNAKRDYAKYGHGYYCYRGLGWIGSGSVYRVQNLAPVNGHWTSWSQWSSCSATCNGGARSRRRSCTNPLPSNGGVHCRGISSQTQPCNRNHCQIAVNGHWTNWSQWSSCSASCNGGARSRRRSCTNPPPSNGGAHCRGISSQTQLCNRNHCQILGVWTSWSPWGSCSRSCGGGTRSRIRNCINRSQFSASAVCRGPRSRTQRCNTNVCPTNGAWSAWGSWSSCSRTCGIGTQARSRTCSNPFPRNGGAGCRGPSSENRRCSSNNCPVCVEGAIVTDRCGQRCRCSGGRPVGCTRVRREFTSMSRADREKYIRTVINASTNARYKPDYDRLITLHKTIFRTGIHERDHFLPWHRWYVLQYENLLRRIDCTVTVPYWDWSVVSQTPWRGRASDLWHNGNSGFGGNGEQTPEQCVTNGPFRRGTWNVVPSAGGGCLRRQLNLTGNPPDSVAVAEVLRTRAVDFVSFEVSLRINLHDTVHCMIGGHMCSFDSATSPEFMLHHGFIDKIWTDWQRQSSAHRNAHFPTVAGNMPGTRQLHARAVLDNFRLPGRVRVQYQATTIPQLRSVLRRLGELTMSALTQIPRRHFYVLSQEAIKLFNVSKAEVETAIRLGLKLLPRSGTLPGSTNSIETSLGFRIDSLKRTNFVRGK